MSFLHQRFRNPPHLPTPAQGACSSAQQVVQKTPEHFKTHFFIANISVALSEAEVAV